MFRRVIVESFGRLLLIHKVDALESKDSAFENLLAFGSESDFGR